MTQSEINTYFDSSLAISLAANRILNISEDEINSEKAKYIQQKLEEIKVHLEKISKVNQPYLSS